MSDYGVAIDRNTIRFERLVFGSAARVWTHLTDSDSLAKWLAQGKIPCEAGAPYELRFDVVEMPDEEEAGATVLGTVTRCDVEHLLELAWGDDAAGSRVTFVLRPQDEQVQLALTHTGVDAEMLAACATGWHAHLSMLQARLTGQEPEPFPQAWNRLWPEYEQRLQA